MWIFRKSISPFPYERADCVFGGHVEGGDADAAAVATRTLKPDNPSTITSISVFLQATVTSLCQGLLSHGRQLVVSHRN